MSWESITPAMMLRSQNSLSVSAATAILRLLMLSAGVSAKRASKKYIAGVIELRSNVFSGCCAGQGIARGDDRVRKLNESFLNVICFGHFSSPDNWTRIKAMNVDRIMGIAFAFIVFDEHQLM